MPNRASPSLSQAEPKFRDIAAQIFRLATVFAEHKITKTKAKLEKNHHHCRTQRRWQNHICP
jgi:hypothetical protein